MPLKISRSHRLLSILTAIVLGCASAPIPPPPSQYERRDIPPDGAVDGGPVDEEAVPTVTVQPQFPEQARPLGESGRVELQVVVDEQGDPGEIIVVRSSPDFDDAAINAVQQWRFKPAKRYGQPIAVRVRIPMEFHHQ
jgi:periplasmic protein TonB